MRVTAMRAIIIMMNREPVVGERSKLSLDSNFVEKLRSIIPRLLENIDDSVLHLHNTDIDNMNAALLDFEISGNQSVSDKQIIYVREHARRAAMECLANIADSVGYSNVRNVMKPIIEFVESLIDSINFHLFLVSLTHGIIGPQLISPS